MSEMARRGIEGVPSGVSACPRARVYRSVNVLRLLQWREMGSVMIFKSHSPEKVSIEETLKIGTLKEREEEEFMKTDDNGYPRPVMREGQQQAPTAPRQSFDRTPPHLHDEHLSYHKSDHHLRRRRDNRQRRRRCPPQPCHRVTLRNVSHCHSQMVVKKSYHGRTFLLLKSALQHWVERCSICALTLTPVALQQSPRPHRFHITDSFAPTSSSSSSSTSSSSLPLLLPLPLPLPPAAPSAVRHPKSTLSVTFSRCGTYFASSHGDHTVKIIHFATRRLVACLEGHPRTPWTVKFHPQNRRIVASGCLGKEVSYSSFFFLSFLLSSFFPFFFLLSSFFL